jgi:formylglycine-generating enzyme required for sulfatase activity
MPSGKAAQRWGKSVQALLWGALIIAVAAGLFGWRNRLTLAERWRWYTVTRPYRQRQFRPYVLGAAQERALTPGDLFKECAADCPAMIVVPAGSFLMGSPTSERGHQSFEQPLHRVTIAKPFAMSKFEVTFAEWDACAAYGDCDAHIKDSGWGRGRRPVINVSWKDARRYVVWLSKMTGKPYRLPSEAEYEYAARAGMQTAYPWGDDIGMNNADCNGCGSRWDDLQAAPVGSFPPNRFGLYDMVGNVFEWVEDCLHANYKRAPADGSAWIAGGVCSGRIIRGGSWGDRPVDLRSADRPWSPAIVRRNFIGFRVARTLLSP